MEDLKWKSSFCFLESLFSELLSVEYISVEDLMMQIVRISKNQFSSFKTGLIIDFQDGTLPKIFEKDGNSEKFYSKKKILSKKVEQEIRNGSIVISSNPQHDFQTSKSLKETVVSQIIGIPIQNKSMIGVLYLENPKRDLVELFSTKEAYKRTEAILLILGRLLGNLVVNSWRESSLRQQQKRQERESFECLIGKSRAMQEIYLQIEKLAPTKLPVLIIGESGTGKELVARAIHNLSLKKEGPFIAENIASVSETLFEREVFGNEKGAFTGAYNVKKGLFELAENGTLFLDEIGELSKQMQKKLLRVIQNSEIRRVGGDNVIKINVRFLFATNKDISNPEIFRPDLYYRIKVGVIKLPPLKDHPEDIPLLVDFFTKKYKTPPIGQEILKVLMKYSWPGNIRELENEILYCGAMAKGSSEIQVSHCRPQIQNNSFTSLPANEWKLSTLKKNMEKEVIHNALLQFEGKTRAEIASLLGISRDSLLKKCNEYNLGIGKRGRSKNNGTVRN